MFKSKKNLAKFMVALATLSSINIFSVESAFAAFTQDSQTALSISSGSATLNLGEIDSATTLGLTPAAITYNVANTADTVTVTVSLSAPSASSKSASDITLNQTSSQATASKFTIKGRSSNTYSFAQNATTTAVAVTGLATIGFTPDVVGTYTLTFTDGAATPNVVTRVLTVKETDPSNHTLAFSLGGTSAATTISANDSATVSLKTGFIASAGYDSITVKALLLDAPTSGLGTVVNLDVTESSTSSGNVIFSTSDQVSGSTGVVVQTGAASATNNVKLNATLYAPSVAGTYIVRITTLYMSKGENQWVPAITPLTFTVTVTAPSTTALANSVSYLRADTTAYTAGGTAATDSAVVTAKVSATSTTDTTPEATIWVFQKNATSTANESMTVSIDGPAFANTAASTRPTAGQAVTVKYDSSAADGSPIYIWSAGTAGKATITVKTISGLLLGTKTVNFYGAVTKLTAASDPTPKTIVRSGGKTLSGAWDINATDAAGQPVKNLTLSCVSSNTTVIASCAFTDNKDGSYTMDLTSATGSTSGQTADITVRVVDPAVTTSTAYISATAVKVTTGSSVNKVTIATDKSSYSPGEQMIVTVTATDSSGNPVYDSAALAALSSNKTVSGLANVATSFVAGKADSIDRKSDGTVKTTYRVFAPATAGSFDLYLDYTDAALATQRASVSATVADAAVDAATDAANEATDAANAATDAALAAADAADAATAAAQDASDAVAALSASVSKMIASLKAQITSLTNLVIKIQKKVKA